VTVRAVDHIRFTIEPGEMAGDIGANRAGKPTTAKMRTNFHAGHLQIAVPLNDHLFQFKLGLQGPAPHAAMEPH